MTHPANLDPLLLALVEKLPAKGEPFSSTEQEAWLTAAGAVLTLLNPPLWTQEARSRLRTARSGAEPSVDPDDVPKPCVPVSCPPVEEQEINAIVTTFEWAPDIDPAVIEEAMEKMRLHVEIEGAGLGSFGPPKEAPSTTSADAVDDEPGEVEMPSGAGDALPTSPTPSVDSPAATSPTAPSSSAPTTPSTDAPAPVSVDPPEPGKKRHFTADQKGAILRRVVREGMAAVADDTLIHPSTLHRWMREVPVSVQTFEDEWQAEQLEAERERPVSTQKEAIAKRAAELAAKPAVPWERRPFDPDAVRRSQADSA